MRASLIAMLLSIGALEVSGCGKPSPGVKRVTQSNLKLLVGQTKAQIIAAHGAPARVLVWVDFDTLTLPPECATTGCPSVLPGPGQLVVKDGYLNHISIPITPACRTGLDTVIRADSERFVARLQLNGSARRVETFLWYTGDEPAFRITPTTEYLVATCDARGICTSTGTARD